MIEINIHMDFTDGTEISSMEGKKKFSEGVGFNTHCLDFFTTDNMGSTLKFASGREVSSRSLQKGMYPYLTVKEIRNSHNLSKMARSGAFTLKEDLTWQH